MMKDEAYVQIASFLTHSKHKKELTESTLHQKMNCLFTAMTRSMESLWIIEEQSHKKADLFQALGQEQGRLETVSLDIRKSTLEEWLHEVNRLIDAGHDEKAKCIYQQQCGIKSRDHCEWVPFEDYRQAYDSRQDYKSLKKDDTPDEHRQYAQEPGRVLCFSSGIAMVSEKRLCTKNDHKSAQNLADEKKILNKILKKNWSKEILEETLIDRESFFRLLTNLDPTSRDKDQPFISRLLQKKEDRGALSNFVSFCEENQNRVHCGLFTCMIDEYSALHYLANFDSGRKLITIFFNELELQEYLAQDARSHAAILNFLRHIEENDRENILGVVKQKVKDLKTRLDPELYKKIKDQKKILFQHVKITTSIPTHNKLISTASAIVKPSLSKSKICSSSTSLPGAHSCKEKSPSAMKDVLPRHLDNPLYEAVKKNNLKETHLLINLGFAMEPALDGETPLHLAAKRQHLNIAQALIQKYPGNIDDKTDEGWTALHYAVFNQHEDLVTLLITAKADLNAINLAGATALHLASQNNALRMVRLLLQAGAIMIASDHGETPLHLAAAYGYLPITQALIQQYPESINQQNHEGYTALHCAVSENKEEMTRYLLEAGSDFNLKTSCGKTPLHLAAGSGHLSITRALIEQYPGSINDQNNEGWTALHCAVLENKKDVICYLLEARSDCNLKTHRGKTPREIAVQLEFLEIIELFDQLSIDNQSKGSLNSSAVKRFF
jgi:ankyrin repeat protein